MNPLIPVGIIAALMLSAKNLKEKIQRISITGFAIKPGKISLAEVVLNVTLKVYNPNTQAVPFGYFQGYVYRGGTRLGRIMYDEKAAGNVKTFPGKAETPATFQVVISGLGIVANLYNIIRNLRNSKAVDTTLTVDGVLNIGGFDVPVKFSYDLRNAIGGIGSVGNVIKLIPLNQKSLSSQLIELTGDSYNAIDWENLDGTTVKAEGIIRHKKTGLLVSIPPANRISKPYAKMEFGSNDELQTYFRKPCADTKFSLNG